MKYKLVAVVVCLILLLGVGLLGGGLLGVVLLQRHTGRGTTPVTTPEQDPQQESDPAYGLPLHITIEDVPEVPEGIRGPSPPIEETEE